MSMLIVDLQGYITHTCSYKVAVQFKTCQKRMNFWLLILDTKGKLMKQSHP